MIKKIFPIICLIVTISCATEDKNIYAVTSEFEDQEYIWLSWVETGFLGGDPFYYTALKAMKEITPYCKVRLFYGLQSGCSKQELEESIFEKLLGANIDTSRVHLFFNEQNYGAIQDPGPVFLRNKNGEFAIADFTFVHPDERTESIDKNVASQLRVPTISSPMISEGGARQTNGKGTLILVEAVELDRNKSMTKEQIEGEYNRVLGVKKVIWLKSGPKEEEWGKLENGKYGIGTGGHIDEFCRFADEHTILLAEVSNQDIGKDEILKETYRRLEENYNILENETDQDGQPFKIIRIPTAPVMTKRIDYKSLSTIEKFWFENVTQDTVEFYLATSYLNLVIANGVVVTSKYWNKGLPDDIKQKDANAKHILEQSFPGRRVVQIDCMPLHHDGAGIHCHSRNEPKK